MAEVRPDTRIGGEGVAVVRPDTSLGGEGVAEVRPDTSLGGEGVAVVRPDTSLGGEDVAEVRPDTRLGGDGEEAGRERIAFVLRPQEGDFWAPGGPVSQRVEEANQAEAMVEDIEGVRVELVGEEVEGNALGGDLAATQPPPPLPEGPHLPDLEELQNTFIPTLKHCPKAARGDLAREMTSLWQRLAGDPGEERLWVLEFMFTRAILFNCGKRRRS